MRDEHRTGVRDKEKREKGKGNPNKKLTANHWGHGTQEKARGSRGRDVEKQCTEQR